MDPNNVQPINRERCPPLEALLGKNNSVLTHLRGQLYNLTIHHKPAIALMMDGFGIRRLPSVQAHSTSSTN
jgi:hypothetical protein